MNMKQFRLLLTALLLWVGGMNVAMAQSSYEEYERSSTVDGTTYITKYKTYKDVVTIGQVVYEKFYVEMAHYHSSISSGEVYDDTDELTIYCAIGYATNSRIITISFDKLLADRVYWGIHFPGTRWYYTKPGEEKAEDIEVVNLTNSYYEELVYDSDNEPMIFGEQGFGALTGLKRLKLENGRHLPEGHNLQNRDQISVYVDHPFYTDLGDFKEVIVNLDKTDTNGIGYVNHNGSALAYSLGGSSNTVNVPAQVTLSDGETYNVTRIGGSNAIPGIDNNSYLQNLTFKGDIEVLPLDMSQSTNLKTITFEGNATIGSNMMFATSPNLEEVTFNGVNDFSGALTQNTNLKRITFHGTVPTLERAAADYVANPGNVVVYIDRNAGVTKEELANDPVWKAFKAIGYVGENENYLVSNYLMVTAGKSNNAVEVWNGTILLGTISKDGGSLTNKSSDLNSVELRIPNQYLDMILFNGFNIINSLTPVTPEDEAYAGYTFYTINNLASVSSIEVRFKNVPNYLEFSQLMIHQSGSGTTTANVTRSDGTTEQVSLSNGTDYRIIDIPWTDFQKIDLIFQGDNEGTPVVLHGSQQLAANRLQYSTTNQYYYTSFTLADMQATDFTVRYPISYEQQEGIVKTTIVNSNLLYSVYYDFESDDDSMNDPDIHNGDVETGATEVVYHLYGSGTNVVNNYEIQIYANSKDEFRVRENGEDLTDLAVQTDNYWTYTLQHADQNGVVVIDNAEDMQMSLTTNTTDVVSFLYKENGTQKTVNFDMGTTDLGMSSKITSDHELVISTNVSFTLMCNGQDISNQYGSSNVNASNASKTDYHFPASVLNFTDGERLNLIMMTKRTMPVTASSNTKDSRNIKIETFQYNYDGQDLTVDETTMKTWGSLALAPIEQYAKIYFYHTDTERAAECYVNGNKIAYLSNPSSINAQAEYNQEEGYYALTFNALGDGGYLGSYETLDVQVVFTDPNDLDPTKANAVVSMGDESKMAFAEMTYDIYRQYGDEQTKTETMRKGLKIFEMEKDHLTDNSFMEYKVYLPEGYEARIYVEGTDYTENITVDDNVTTVNNVQYTTATLRFDKDFVMKYRSQNTSWLVNVTKMPTEAGKWDIALLGKPKARLTVSFFDELNANKDLDEREELTGISIEDDAHMIVPRKAATAWISIEYMNEYDAQTDSYEYDNLGDWLQDYSLVVKADGQDVSNLFTLHEFGYTADNLSPQLLAAQNWIIGFKNKNNNVITHTATIKGDIDRNVVLIQWISTEGILNDYQIDANTPTTTETTDENPIACRPLVTLADSYTFKAYFNGQELNGFTKNSDGAYAADFVEPATTDGSWVFEFSKIPEEILQYASTLKGDVNGDGKVSIADAVEVVNIILGNPAANARMRILEELEQE